MPDVQIVVKAKDEASKTLKGIGGSLDGLNKGLAVLGGVGVAAIGATAYALGNLAMAAVKAEPVRIGFDNLTKSIGSSADAMLDKLRPATMNLMSDLELMQSTNKLVAMGLAETEDEAAQLANMAVTLGMAMGTEAGPALENFTLMLANQSIPRLDTFGISSGKVRERIQELMDATADMTREEAFMVAVMEEGETAMGNMEGIADSTAVKIGAVETAWANAKDEIGRVIVEALMPMVEEYLPDIIQLIKDLVPLFEENLPKAIDTVIQVFEGWKAILDEIQKTMDYINKISGGELGRTFAEPGGPGWPGMRGDAIGGRTLMNPGANILQGPTSSVIVNTGDVYGMPNMQQVVEDAIEQRALGMP